MRISVPLYVVLVTILCLTTAEQSKNPIRLSLKRTGQTNADLLDMLDYANSLDSSEKPSYLQLKFAANQYPFSADPDYSDDTDSIVHMKMRDIVQNGFTSVLSIGSNRQEFYCIFDTGSSVMFVNSFECEVEHCEMNAQFNPHSSTTFHDLDETIDLTYGGGFLDGDEAQDTVWVHDLEVTGQTIALVTDEDDESTINFSCLVGLSYPDLAPNGELLLFDNIMQQGLLDSNMFTVYYYPDGEHAELTFGQINHQFYRGEITYVPVREQMHWNIPVEDIKIDGESLGFCEHTCQGLVDTGTNLNTFEEDQMDIIFQYIKHGGSCDDFSGLPTITYTIAGRDFDLDPEDYYITDEIFPGRCSPAFFGMDVFLEEDHPALVLGVTFMQKYFTIFDRDNDQVGFAVSNPNLSLEEPTESDRIQTNAD